MLHKEGNIRKGYMRKIRVTPEKSPHAVRRVPTPIVSEHGGTCSLVLKLFSKNTSKHHNILQNNIRFTLIQYLCRKLKHIAMIFTSTLILNKPRCNMPHYIYHCCFRK